MNDLLAPFGRLRPWTAVGVVASACALWGLVRVLGVELLLWQLLLLAVAALAAAAIVSALRPDTEPGPELRTRTINEPTWRPFVDVNRWEDKLIFAETRHGRFDDSTARRRLHDLVNERLRLRRGLSLDNDPEKCRDLLGESTYAFLTGPAPDCPDERQLDAHLRRIEEI